MQPDHPLIRSARSSLIALALLTLSACSSLLLGGMNTLSRSGELEVATGMTFDLEHRLALDIYSPPGATGAPVVVFFYGGYWRYGERAQYRWVGEALARQGVVVFVPDYRKYPDTGLDGFMADAAKAVAFAHAHAAAHGGDPKRIVLMGHSAGAHLAGLLATDAHWLQPHGLTPGSLCGVIGLAGPFDFLPLTGPDLREIFSEDHDEQLRSQPIHFVDGDEPPMLLLHGEADTTVGRHNSANLAAALNKAGVHAQFKLYPELTHVGILLALSGRFAKDAPVMPDVIGFAKACP
jgi:acetyl esterase/lipase